jgi:hypothetical protein
MITAVEFATSAIPVSYDEWHLKNCGGMSGLHKMAGVILKSMMALSLFSTWLPCHETQHIRVQK